jgi:MFS family permease
VVIAVLVATYCVFGAGLAVFNVHSLSVRQALVPTEMIGRVVSVYRLASWATIPFGSLLGGALASQLGTRTALLLAAAGLTFSAVLFAWSQGTRDRLERREPGSPLPDAV